MPFIYLPKLVATQQQKFQWTGLEITKARIVSVKWKSYRIFFWRVSKDEDKDITDDAHVDKKNKLM